MRTAWYRTFTLRFREPRPPSSMNSPEPAYSVERRDPERARTEVLSLWKSSGFWTHPSDEAARARYDWLHLRNPAGPSRIYLLKETATDKVVGSVGACTRVFFTKDSTQRGSLLVDFVVDPAHRSLFPAMLLQRTAREQELATHALLYALPEPKAVPVFKRLGSDVVAESRRYARIVRFRHGTKRLLWAPLASLSGALIDLADLVITSFRLRGTPLTGRWSEGFGPEIEAIWARGRAGAVALGERSPEFLRWRFLERPGEAARIFLLQHRKTGEPRAYFVCTINGSTAAINDFLCVGSRDELIESLLLVCRAARRAGASVIYLELALGDAYAEALRTAHFMPRTTRPCFVKTNPDGRAPEWLTRADEDV
jgi:hypothetical protein